MWVRDFLLFTQFMVVAQKYLNALNKNLLGYREVSKAMIRVSSYSESTRAALSPLDRLVEGLHSGSAGAAEQLIISIT